VEKMFQFSTTASFRVSKSIWYSDMGQEKKKKFPVVLKGVEEKNVVRCGDRAI